MIEKLPVEYFCHVTGKIAFKTRTLAKKQARKLLLHLKKKYDTYKCPHCDWFHVTSNLGRDTQQIAAQKQARIAQKTAKKHEDPVMRAKVEGLLGPLL
jgi:peptide subunit release factor 1 (eRF1)